jgi:hypothetical protein
LESGFSRIATGGVAIEGCRCVVSRHRQTSAGVANGADRPGGSPMTAARLAAYVMALAASLALGHFLLGLPIQVSDSFGHMLQLTKSWQSLIVERFSQEGFLRPAMWLEMKIVYELADGNYTRWFRATHVVQVVTLTGLFIALIRPRTWRDVACVPLALAVLFGVHTFVGTVAEAFPINTYMTMLLLCVTTAVIALRPHAWWSDAAAAVLFVIAALTVETGLLVWVIVAGAALLGARGVSRTGVVLVTALLGAYFFVRFIVFDVGLPGLVERSSGFGFRVLDPPELIARFGDHPLLFYAYNVMASMLSVLFSEPTGGVFWLTRRLASGAVPPFMIVNVIASTGVVLLLAAFAAARWRQWLARRFDDDDRLVLLFAIVLAANAVIGYPYTKDVIMSPAGVFLAAATFGAARWLLAETAIAPMHGARAIAIVAAVAIVSSTWSFRVMGLHARLRRAAVVERLDWAYIDSEIAAGRIRAEDEQSRTLLNTLQDDALVRRPAPPPLYLPFQPLLGE